MALAILVQVWCSVTRLESQVAAVQNCPLLVSSQYSSSASARLDPFMLSHQCDSKEKLKEYSS